MGIGLERKAAIDGALAELGPRDLSVRRFSHCTPDYMMEEVYTRLVPESEIEPGCFREISDPNLIAERNRRYIAKVTSFDEAGCGDGRRPYKNDRTESKLVFYDGEGRIVGIPYGEELKDIWRILIDCEVDTTNPVVGLKELADGKSVVRVVDLGIGVGSVIQKVRDQLLDLDFEVEASGVNLTDLPVGSHPYLKNLFVGEFEGMEFENEQFDLLYSSLGCSSYVLDEGRFVSQLEKIMAPGSATIMDISSTAFGRWEAALEDSESLEYEVLYSIGSVEEIMHHEARLKGVCEHLENFERHLAHAYEDYAKFSSLPGDIVASVLDEFKGMESEFDNAPILVEIFQSGKYPQPEVELLSYVYELLREVFEYRERKENAKSLIKSSKRYIVDGLLIRKK